MGVCSLAMWACTDCCWLSFLMVLHCLLATWGLASPGHCIVAGSLSFRCSLAMSACTVCWPRGAWLRQAIALLLALFPLGVRWPCGLALFACHVGPGFARPLHCCRLSFFSVFAGHVG